MIIIVPAPSTPLHLRVNVIPSDVSLLTGLDVLSEQSLDILIATNQINSETQIWTLPLRRTNGHLLLV
jgi:hypothetical protein